MGVLFLGPRGSLRNLRSLREAAPDIPGLAAESEPLEELLSKRAKGRPAKPPGESAGEGTQSLAG